MFNNGRVRLFIKKMVNVNPVDIIFIKNNQTLLVKRAESEENNLWSIPGGAAEEGETFETALKREIREELNCSIGNYQYFKSYFLKINDKKSARTVYFYGELEGEIKLNDELKEYSWFDLNDPELLELSFAFDQKNVILDYIEFMKKKTE